MKKTIYILIVGILLNSYGCTGFLDNIPKGMTIPQYTEDYQKLMNAQSLLSSVDGKLDYLTDNTHLLDKSGSASYYIFINKSEVDRNLFSFKSGQVYGEGTKDNIWNNSYSRLFTINTVVNSVMESVGANEVAKKKIKAEALFARAFEYYNLVNIYGKQYNKQTAESDLGVPYIKDADINLKYERETVANVYKNILADLSEAESDIPAISANKAHPNQAALYSFYARIYLSMSDYANALKYANMALDLNSSLLNLNDYSKVEGTTWGRVHKKGNPSERLPDINHPEANYIKWLTGSLQGNVLLSREMRDLYAKDINEAKDLRKEYFYAENSVNLGGSTSYFPGECAFVLYANFNVGFTSVENYFIAAECEARTGSIDRAMQLINTVRSNRISGISLLTAANNEEALIKVLEEKRREFCLRGPMRLYDLKRLNLETKFQKTITHKTDGEEFILPPNDIRYVLPVNQEIIDFNPDFPVYNR